MERYLLLSHANPVTERPYIVMLQPGTEVVKSEDAQAEIAALQRQVADLTAKLERNDGELDKRDTCLAAMTDNYTAIKQERDNLRLRIRAVDTEHENLKKDRQAMIVPVTAMEDELTTLRAQVQQLRAALTQCVAAFVNKGEATNLYMWNERMKKANQHAQTALDATT